MQQAVRIRSEAVERRRMKGCGASREACEVDISLLTFPWWSKGRQAVVRPAAGRAENAALRPAPRCAAPVAIWSNAAVGEQPLDGGRRGMPGGVWLRRR